MNTALWIIQILLAVVFLTTGTIKFILPKKNLEKVFEWSRDFSLKKIRIIAAFEIIGAFGLFLPGVYSIYLLIIPISAVCLAIIAVLAMHMHYKLGTNTDLIINSLLFILLTIVAIGRFAM